jgi:hypothetical protein
MGERVSKERVGRAPSPSEERVSKGLLPLGRGFLRSFPSPLWGEGRVRGVR